jgi:hypothetical protein
MPHIYSDEESKKFENNLIWPDQTVYAEIVSVENFDKSNYKYKDKNGDEYWKVCLKIINDSGDTQNIFDNFTFSSKPTLAARVKACFTAFGYDTKKGLDIENPSDLIGKVAKADIETNEYNGKKSNKVKFFGGYHRIEAKTKDDGLDIPF